MNHNPLKFRVWDAEAEKFIYFPYHESMEISINSYNPVIKFKSSDKLFPWKDIQQDTGVPDKFIHDIYEGDLISYRGRIGVVEFFAGMFVCSWNWGENDDQTETELGYMLTAEMEIVGHKYKTT